MATCHRVQKLKTVMIRAQHQHFRHESFIYSFIYIDIEKDIKGAVLSQASVFSTACPSNESKARQQPQSHHSTSLKS